MSRLVRAAVMVVGVLVLLPFGVASATSSGVPFSDPSATGYIALCDLAGNNVTSGSVTTKPFVWKAVSSAPAPKSYSGKGQNTALTIFQPRQGVDPGDWNGDQLTGASFYQKHSPPAAVATYKDISLETIIKEYPPSWDGLYQLRMISARDNYGDYTASYPSTVIQVTGSTWHVVQGGSLACAAAHSESNETFAGIPVLNPHHPAAGTPTSVPTPDRAAVPASAPSAAVQSGSDQTTPARGHVITAALTGVTSAKSSHPDSIPVADVAVGALVIFGAFGAGALWRRRGAGAS